MEETGLWEKARGRGEEATDATAQAGMIGVRETARRRVKVRTGLAGSPAARPDGSGLGVGRLRGKYSGGSDEGS